MSEGEFPAATPMYRYQGFEKCVEIIDRECERYEYEETSNPYVIFYDVDERSFLEYFECSPNHPFASLWSIYHFASSTLLFTMSQMTGMHSTAQGAFVKAFNIWQDKQRSRLRYTGDQSVRGANRSKKADASWKPADLPSSRGEKWPTVAIEVKWSETRANLKADAKFWLDDSKGDVNVAITISISRRGKISIERWNLSRPSGDLFPAQTMEIERLPDGPKITGEMKVNFRDIFLRAKQVTESDFEISHDDLNEMADDVWHELDLWNAPRLVSLP